MEYVSMWALAITSQQYDRFNKSYTVRKDDCKYYAFNEVGEIVQSGTIHEIINFLEEN